MLGRIFLVLALLLAGLVPAGAQATLKAADLVRQFEDVGFPVNEAYPGASGPQYRFLRAPQPLALSVSEHGSAGPAARQMSQMLAGIAATLRQEADVGVEVGNSRTGAFNVSGVSKLQSRDVAASFNDQDPGLAAAFSAGMEELGCFAYTLFEEDGEIFAGTIVVDIERPTESWNACLYRGVLHLLGLQGSSDAPGVFREPYDAGGLTRRDLAIVRMAFDPRLKPGMTLAEARPRLPAIAADAIGG